MKAMLDDLIEWILKLMSTDTKMSSEQKKRMHRRVFDDSNKIETETPDKAVSERYKCTRLSGHHEWICRSCLTFNTISDIIM